MTPLRALILLTAALAGAPAAAQVVVLPPPPPGDDVLSLRAGDRVRVWASDATPLTAAVGTVNASNHEGLALMIDKRLRLVPFAALRKLEVRRARRHARTGALVGATLGAVASMFLDEIFDEDLRTWEWAAGVAAFTGAGAGVGAVVGHRVWTHRWESLAMAVPARPPAPAPPGPPRRSTLSFSFRF